MRNLLTRSIPAVLAAALITAVATAREPGDADRDAPADTGKHEQARPNDLVIHVPEGTPRVIVFVRKGEKTRRVTINTDMP